MYCLWKEENKEKLKQTLLKRYNVTHQMHIPEVRRKVSEAVKKKGKERIEKIKKTNLQKRGVEWVMQKQLLIQFALTLSFTEIYYYIYIQTTAI